MFSLKTRPLIILFIRLKHPIYASKSGQLGYCTSCGNDKLKLLQIRKHFYSFCIRRGGGGAGERRGWRLKGSGKERKCSAIIQCGVNKTNTSLKTFPVQLSTEIKDMFIFLWYVFTRKSTVQNELALYLETGVQCTLYLAYVDPRCLNATMWFQLKT